MAALGGSASKMSKQTVTRDPSPGASSTSSLSQEEVVPSPTPASRKRPSSHIAQTGKRARLTQTKGKGREVFLPQNVARAMTSQNVKKAKVIISLSGIIDGFSSANSNANLSIFHTLKCR